MNAITDLSKLLQSLQPIEHNDLYVFCSVPIEKFVFDRRIVSTIQEKEGLSLIVTKGYADEYSIPYELTMKWITLQVHSSLEAIGMTDAISEAFTKAKIPCNVVAGFRHDHLFVPSELSTSAMHVLTNIQKAVLKK